MKTGLAIGIAGVMAWMPGPAPVSAGQSADAARPAWVLVWSDEFPENAIDRQKWNFDVDCWGGGNNERQCYTDREANARVEDGRLVITARRERYSGPALPGNMRGTLQGNSPRASRRFTSARMVTRGLAAWKYGRIEIRAKLPQGQGVWPALWMLPETDSYGKWAASGEIDILEAVNLGVVCETCEPGGENTILGTLHFGGQWPGNAFASSEISYPPVLEGFHTFGLVWTDGRIDWLVDGQVYATRVADEWHTTSSREPGAPFDRPFHLILNLAIGGNLPEGRGRGGVDEDGFPKAMEIDWVRVWQCDDRALGGSNCEIAGSGN